MKTPGGRGPQIAVVVATCDRFDALAGCLAALGEQTLPEAAREIVVIDNSQDGVARARFRAARRLPPQTRFVVADRPGLSRARNRGVGETSAEIVAFIDDDARAEPAWLAQLLAGFAAAPEAGVAGGPVAPIWQGEPPAWLGAWHEGFLSLVDRGPVARDLAAGEWLAGANIAFRRAALLQAGGFDEALGRQPGTLLGNEEIAAVERIRSAGHAIRYLPGARVGHVVPAERLTHGWMRRRIAWQAVSDLIAEAARSGDGRAPQRSVAALWQPIAAFLEKMPPECRNLVGLTRDLNDAALARAQGEAISALIALLAGDGGSLETALLRAA